MKVLVCGAGQVGSNIARQLAGEGNDVTVIDQSQELVRKISDSFDARGIVGHASHPDVLKRAGAEECDMMIAVTYADEVNMVACQVAHTLFNVPMKIARVRSQAYLDPRWGNLFGRDNMPIDVRISPEIEVARTVKRALDVPGAFDMIPFADDRVRLIGVHISEDSPTINTPLRQLTELFPDLHCVVTGIFRNERLIVPDDDDQMLPGDDVYFIVRTDHLSRAMPLFGHEENQARRIVIVGGGNIGLFLARQIEEEQPAVKLKVIERDARRAEYIAEQLKRAVVLHGSALETDILQEASVHSAEAIVALTNDDQVNLIASLMAKKMGAQTAVTLINNQAYDSLTASIGIDVAVNPRATTVSGILQHVRRGRIRQVYSVRDGGAEVIDAEALETSPLVGVPLREAELPEDTIIGAIVRGDEVLLPRGGTVIQAHDRVILFALRGAIREIEKMFSVRLEFF